MPEFKLVAGPYSSYAPEDKDMTRTDLPVDRLFYMSGGILTRFIIWQHNRGQEVRRERKGEIENSGTKIVACGIEH